MFLLYHFVIVNFSGAHSIVLVSVLASPQLHDMSSRITDIGVVFYADRRLGLLLSVIDI